MTTNDNPDADAKPKIVVDDDWKARAQAEKQQLADEAKKPTPQKPPVGGDEAAGAPREIPPASFAALVNSLAMQTMFALGAVEDPNTKKRYVDLDLAKFHIDTLIVLQEKTKGNLTDEENKLLDQVVYELRMNFVHISQHVTKSPPPQAPKDPPTA